MIYISKKLQQQIRAESEKHYPNECCGILFGELEEDNPEVCFGNPEGRDVKTSFIKRVESIQPIRNSFEDNERYHRFLITPEIMMKAELEARKREQDIVGFYHSHPGKPAFPSEYDREHALPVYSYIITSVVFGIAVEVNSFELSVEKEESCFYSEDIWLIEENVESTKQI